MGFAEKDKASASSARGPISVFRCILRDLSRNRPVFLRYNKVVTPVFTGVNWAHASPDISFPLVVYRRGDHLYGDSPFTALLGSSREPNDAARIVQPPFLDLAP
jgi:hypothetical protein